MATDPEQREDSTAAASSSAAALPSTPSFKFDQNETSEQNLLSRNGSGYESQYGSLFGSRFSLTDGSGVFISSFALTVIISAIVLVGIVLVAVIITLAVMLSSCQNSTGKLLNNGLVDICSSYRLNIELNNTARWAIPYYCESDIANYIHGGQYFDDIKVTIDSARKYLKTLNVAHVQSYGVVFDIDDTALSSIYYWDPDFRSFGIENYISAMKMNYTKASPIIPVLNLYREVLAANWSAFFVSERPESASALTIRQLVEAGYKGWTSLLLRSSNDSGLPVQAYKANKRVELEKQGYKILSVVGDQWSDITGSAAGARTFKLPNPMYQIL